MIGYSQTKLSVAKYAVNKFIVCENAYNAFFCELIMTCDLKENVANSKKILFIGSTNSSLSVSLLFFLSGYIHCASSAVN